MTETLSRRSFLLYGGATLAGVTLGEAGRRYLARADERAAAWRPPKIETFTSSVCRECPAACGVRVRIVDDVPVKLDGNPKCPIGRGRLCAKGQAAIESYFDPDRIVGPAKRMGPRGAGEWERIEWDEAIATLSAALKSGGTDGAGPSLAVGVAEHGPHADRWAKFWSTTAGDVAWTPVPTADRLQPSLRALTGAEGIPLFDLEQATYVLSFGAPLVEDWLSPVWSQRAFGRFRRGRTQTRGRLVQVEGRRSLTGRKADEWLAVPSSQQIYLAYGIASVLLRENRVNRAFLEGVGGDLAQFERWVLQGYRTDATSAATGVPVVTILRLARELATSDQPLVTVAPDASRALVDAVFALNALLGALDRPGGVRTTRTPPEESSDAVAMLSRVAAGDLTPRVVAFRDSSALRTGPEMPGLADALDSAELVVSFSPFLDEAAAVADLILPASTSLESWHAVVPAPADFSEILAMARPAVEPRLDTREVPDVLKAVAEAVGGPFEEAGPWETSEELATRELDRLWEVRRGAPYVDDYETQWVRRLETGGWWEPSADARAAFGSLVLDSGGWSDPLLELGYIRQALEQIGGLRFPPPPVLPVAGSRLDAGPAAVVTGVNRIASNVPIAQDDESGFPLMLELFTPAVVNTQGNLNQPSLFELLGQPDGLSWHPWAELSPETAAEFGVGHGVMVQVASEHGAIEVPALHVDGMPPGLIAMAFVPAGRTHGRWAELVTTDVRILLGPQGFAEPPQVVIKPV